MPYHHCAWLKGRDRRRRTEGVVSCLHPEEADCSTTESSSAVRTRVIDNFPLYLSLSSDEGSLICEQFVSVQLNTMYRAEYNVPDKSTITLLLHHLFHDKRSIPKAYNLRSLTTVVPKKHC